MTSFYKLLPEGSESFCRAMISNESVIIRVTDPRKTKHGDFRRLPNGDFQISINRMDNPYRFLITFVHEWAHWKVLIKVGHFRNPHGSLWKNTFKELMLPFISGEVFPESLLKPLAAHMINPRATLDADSNLALALTQYDTDINKSFIFELEKGTRFTMPNKKVYILGALRRKRYACEEVSTGRTFLFASHCKVEVCPDEQLTK
jgi:hypothetical protein